MISHDSVMILKLEITNLYDSEFELDDAIPDLIQWPKLLELEMPTIGPKTFSR